MAFGDKFKVTVGIRSGLMLLGRRRYPTRISYYEDESSFDDDLWADLGIDPIVTLIRGHDDYGNNLQRMIPME